MEFCSASLPLFVLTEVALPGRLASLSFVLNVEIDEELTVEHVIDCPSLLMVPVQAHLNELFEVGSPLVCDFRGVIEDDFFEEFAALKLVKGRMA